MGHSWRCSNERAMLIVCIHIFNLLVLGIAFSSTRSSLSGLIWTCMHEQVAETTTSGPDRRITGLIRGNVKFVASAKSRPRAPAFAKVSYILGLRVAASHR